MSREVELKQIFEAVKTEVRTVNFGEVTMTIGIKDGLIRTSKVATSRTQLHLEDTAPGGPRSA